MTNKKIDQSLFNWIFHYNPWTKLWNAFPREKYLDYFNDPNDPKMIVIRSKDVKTLSEIIRKIDGDPERIREL
jgi:hypothetical protein